MPAQPPKSLLLEELGTIEFWAEIQSEHPQILLSVLPHLQERYARELRRLQRAFDDIARRAENLRVRLERAPDEETGEVATAAAALARDARRGNDEFRALLRELVTIYPETDLALLLQHMLMETEHFAEELTAIEPTLPPQNQPPPPPTLEGVLTELQFWARDQREHAVLLRAFLANVSAEDRAALARFERDYRALEQSARRLREAATVPGQPPEALTTEARRLAMVARNLTLEFIRFQEDLLNRYTDPASRFLIRHTLREARRFIEELRASGYVTLRSE
ncbi:MAG TPA: DUF2935 domain-containing protein [Firmicutes bacterium]|nr:DUF2935 domain-containing protein [Bacillota bacterium]